MALAQVASSPDARENLSVAERCMADAKGAGADIVVFPEVFMNHYPPGTPLTEIWTEPIDGPFASGMQRLARSHGLWCVFGMRETGSDNTGRAFNTTLLVDATGACVGIYRKTHLYDAFGARESDSIQPGNRLFDPVDTPWGRMGLLVCYELRFPEIAREQAARGADIVVVPSGWVRGPMKEEHWEHLTVVRALENTVYLLACDQVSDFYCGRSVVVDPMGVKIAMAGEEPELLIAVIDTDRIARVRQKLPSFRHRRPELYTSDRSVGHP